MSERDGHAAARRERPPNGQKRAREKSAWKEGRARSILFESRRQHGRQGTLTCSIRRDNQGLFHHEARRRGHHLHRRTDRRRLLHRAPGRRADRHRAARRRGHADRQPRTGADGRPQVGRSVAHRRRSAPLPLDATGRRPDARGGGRRLRALPQLPGAARPALPLRQRRARSGADPDAAVLQRPQTCAHAPAASDRRARRGGGRHRVGGFSARRDRAAGRPRGANLDVAGRASPGLSAARRRGDRARARPLRDRAPLHLDRRHAGAAQESAAPAEGVRPDVRDSWLAGRGARSGDRRRQGLARSRAARRAGAAHRLGARASARLRPGGRSGGALRRRGGDGLPLALRGVRAAGGGGDGLRDAGGGDRRGGAARGERRRGDLWFRLATTRRWRRS